MSEYVKYPRTPHLPWSRPTSDDKKLVDDSQFIGKEVIVTLKMDGENTSMYADKIHARSVDSANVSHFTRDFVKGIWGNVKHDLAGLRICGENMWAEHTIKYDDLESFFYVFSIWDHDKNWCYNWDETTAMAEVLDLAVVPVIYRGTYDRPRVEWVFKQYADKHEGYVVRTRNGFLYKNFSKHVAKYVRPAFSQKLHESTVHWMYDVIKPNKLKRDDRISSDVDIGLPVQQEDNVGDEQIS